jgi:hypothetical protein
MHALLNRGESIHQLQRAVYHGVDLFSLSKVTVGDRALA